MQPQELLPSPFGGRLPSPFGGRGKPTQPPPVRPAAVHARRASTQLAHYPVAKAAATYNPVEASIKELINSRR